MVRSSLLFFIQSIRPSTQSKIHPTVPALGLHTKARTATQLTPTPLPDRLEYVHRLLSYFDLWVIFWQDFSFFQEPAHLGRVLYVMYTPVMISSVVPARECACPTSSSPKHHTLVPGGATVMFGYPVSLQVLLLYKRLPTFWTVERAAIMVSAAFMGKRLLAKSEE